MLGAFSCRLESAVAPLQVVEAEGLTAKSKYPQGTQTLWFRHNCGMTVSPNALFTSVLRVKVAVSTRTKDVQDPGLGDI